MTGFPHPGPLKPTAGPCLSQARPCPVFMPASPVAPCALPRILTQSTPTVTPRSGVTILDPSPPTSPPPMKGLLEFSERFGNLLSRILLTVLYYAVLGPFALLYQRFADPLRLRRPEKSNWTVWERPTASLKAARKQD